MATLRKQRGRFLLLEEILGNAKTRSHDETPGHPVIGSSRYRIPYLQIRRPQTNCLETF
jgi:hypothetical protein